MNKKFLSPEENKNGPSSNLIALLFLLLLSSILFFINLSGKSFAGDEIVYGYYLEDMYKLMNPVFPDGKLNDLYMIKPPLKTWLQYPLVKIFGFNYFTLRFWDSFFAVLAVLMIFFIGNKLYGRKAGFIAAFGIMTIPAIVKEHWARYNAYDAGFVFAILLFYYLFLTGFDKKYGWVYCGAALAAAFYFKHIASALHLLPVIIWLIVTGRRHILFSRKTFAMFSAFFVFVFAWYIPFYIKNPSFISVFFQDELYRRIMEGYNQGSATVFLYFETLSERLGLWLLPAAVSLIVFVFITFFVRARSEKAKDSHGKTAGAASVEKNSPLTLEDKNMFMLCWILVPLIPLEISSSKLEWYLYPLYPALMIVLGMIVCKSDEWLRSRSIKMNPVFIAALLLAFFMWYQNFSYVRAESPSYSRIYADFYKTGTGGKIYTYLLHEKELNFSEKIDIWNAGTKIRAAGKAIAFEPLLKKLGDDDSMLMLRGDLYRIVHYETQPYEKGKYCYADVTLHHEISAPKIVVFKKDGELEKYLTGNNFFIREMKPLREQVDYSIADNRIFADDVFRIFFGFQLGGDKFEYIVDALSDGRLARGRLSGKFESIAAREDYFIVNHWWEHFKAFAGGNAGTAEFIAGYYKEAGEGTIFVHGMGWGDFTPEQRSVLFPALDKFRFITRKKHPNPLASLLPEMGGRDITIIKKRVLFESLPAGRLNGGDVSSYSFFTLGLDDVFPEGYGEYPYKTVICRSDGELARKLAELGLMLRPVRKPDELIDWNISSDDEFIKHAADLLFSIKYNSFFMADLKKELDECGRGRRMFIDRQIRKLLNKH